MRGAFRRLRVEQRMSDELRFHIESCTDDLVRAGLTPEGASPRSHRVRRCRSLQELPGRHLQSFQI